MRLVDLVLSDQNTRSIHLEERQHVVSESRKKEKGPNEWLKHFDISHGIAFFLAGGLSACAKLEKLIIIMM